MKSRIYVDMKRMIAITVDNKNKYAYSYDLSNIDGSIDYSTKGILHKIDTEIFKEANKELGVDLKDFGVVEINNI